MAVDLDRAGLDSGQSEEPSLRRGGTLGFLSGIVIGAAAGLIGVGGGEFRIPVLLHVLKLPVKEAAGANTVIGLFVVVLSVIRRWGQQQLTADDLTVGAVMAVASVLGATLGARQAHRLPTPLLKRVVCVYLLVVGVWMVVEGLAEAEHSLIEPTGWIRWTLAAAGRLRHRRGERGPRCGRWRDANPRPHVPLRPAREGRRDREPHRLHPDRRARSPTGGSATSRGGCFCSHSLWEPVHSSASLSVRRSCPTWTSTRSRPSSASSSS